MSSATAANDPYVSRTGETWEAAVRVDPVVWSDRKQPLSDAQLSEYERDGFLFLPEVFSERDVTEMLNEAESLAERWPAGEPGLIREPESNNVRSVFLLHRLSSKYQAIFQDDRLVRPVRQLLGSDVYIHQSRVNYKPAFAGKEFFWHSDFETWHVEDGMPRMRAISVSIFLTESHEFNGPLMLVPGSHQTYIRCAGETPENHFEQSLRKQAYGVPSREAMQQLVDRGGIVAPKGPAGSVVLFECNTMHGSTGNLSPGARVNVFAVYNSIENALVEPFGSQPARPDFLAERTVTPIGELSIG